MKTVLITGASGFIGSFIVEEALRRGFTAYAAVRKTSSREYLKDERIRFIEVDLNSKDKLKDQLSSHKVQNGTFDYVIHAAGATKCRKPEDFIRHNFEATKNFIEALDENGMRPERFIYLSSLSIFGPIRENVSDNPVDGVIYDPITESDEPRPNTAYGRSKVMAEKYITSLKDYPYVIFRPTGVYGPREKDYFLMAKSIKSHVDFAVGYKKQEITFVYVKDICQAIFKAIDKGISKRSYFLSDGKVYESKSFSDYIATELGNPFFIRIKAPIFILYIICAVSGWISSLMGKASTLNLDKYNIMKQRNWQCDITPARQEFGYSPEYDLERGTKETIKWYKENGWL